MGWLAKQLSEGRAPSGAGAAAAAAAPGPLEPGSPKWEELQSAQSLVQGQRHDAGEKGQRWYDYNGIRGSEPSSIRRRRRRAEGERPNDRAGRIRNRGRSWSAPVPYNPDQ